MGKMNNMRVTIEEVARIALESPEMRAYIGHELGITNEYLEKVFQYLNSLCKGGIDGAN